MQNEFQANDSCCYSLVTLTGTLILAMSVCHCRRPNVSNTWPECFIDHLLFLKRYLASNLSLLVTLSHHYSNTGIIIAVNFVLNKKFEFFRRLFFPFFVEAGTWPVNCCVNHSPACVWFTWWLIKNNHNKSQAVTRALNINSFLNFVICGTAALVTVKF